MKKKMKLEQFDLFNEAVVQRIEEFAKNDKPIAPSRGMSVKFREPDKFLTPSEEEVKAMVKDTGKSYRKCWFMVSERINKRNVP